MQGGKFLLKSVEIIVSPQPLDVEDRAFRVKRHNEILFAEHNEMHVPDADQRLQQYICVMDNN